MEREIQSLRNQCLLRKDTLQPTLFVIGDLTAIQEAYVIVDDLQYKVSTTLDGLDLAFKIFFALDCQYPKASLSLWQFIQIACFNIADNKANKSVKELVGLATQPFKILGNTEVSSDQK